jgi:amidase
MGFYVSANLHWLGLETVAARIASGDISARAVTEASLSRIARLNPHFNAYIHVFAEQALAAAKAADATLKSGKSPGPLHGVPIGVKDIFEIEGEITTAGLPFRSAYRAASTATVVKKLRAAGAVVLGAQNVTEGIFGEYVKPYGAPVNPWNAAAWPGASSGGSAVAVAAGLCFGAIASDTGGSIRMPSAVNGTTGLKPTWGRVSQDGVFELARTLDHIGPIGRSAADAAVLLDVIADADNTAQGSYRATVQDGVAGMTVGIDRSWIETGVDQTVSDVVMSCTAQLERLGARLVPISLPQSEDIVDIWYDVCAPQVARVHRQSFAAHGESYSPSLAAIIRHGLDMPASTVETAHAKRASYSGELNRALSDVDIVAIPALPFPPPPLEKTQNMNRAMIAALHRFTCPFTLSGAPCITFPGGFGPDSLPIAVQLVARPHAERALLRASYAFQRVTDFHSRHPTLEANK